jgi:BirA family biotin operon repressor/biotin-[acetyl-CoA-carboxylase] ligase
LKLVIKVMSKYIEKKKLVIKYPNDILIKEKKISGILVESFKFQKKIYVILGIGINLIKNPSLKTYKTTNIYREIGKKIDFFDFSEIIYKEMKVIFKCF